MSFVCACWHLLSTGEVYVDLGGYFQRRDPMRMPGQTTGSIETLNCCDVDWNSHVDPGATASGDTQLGQERQE
jgi:hypothetical protein